MKSSRSGILILPIVLMLLATILILVFPNAKQLNQFIPWLLAFILILMLLLLKKTRLNISETEKKTEQLRNFNLQLQQQIEEKASALTIVFERLTDAFVALDSEWHYTYMNEKAGQIFNRDPKKIIGKNIWSEFPEGIGQPFQKAYKKAMEEQQYIYLEEYYPPYERWFENHIYPSPDGLSIFFRDITEKKLTELALKNSEERYRSLIDQASDPIMITDDKGNFLDVNTSFCKQFGYSKEELMRSNISMVIDPIQLETDPIQFDLLLSGVSLFRERRMMRKDGTIIEVEANVKMLPDGRILAIARDITDRKKAEETIRINEQQLKLIYNTTTDVIFLLSFNDNRYRFTSVNKAFLSATGLREEDIIGKFADEVIPESSQPLVFSNYRKAIHNCGTVQWEEISEYPAGRKTGIVSITPVINDKGECSMLVGTVHDITERKKAEEQVLKEKNLSDSVINSLPGVFFLIDQEGKYLRWNKQLENISGYDAGEIAHLHPLDFFEGDEKAMIQNKIGQVFTEGSAEAEAMIITKNSKKIPFYFTAQFIEYEGTPCLIGTGIDITDRNKAEEELRKSEQKYKLLFESNPLPMWMFSKNELEIIDVNEAAIRYYGYTKNEFLQMTIKDLRPAEDVDRFMEEIKSPINLDGHLGTWRHKKKDGTLIYVEIIGHEIIYQGRLVRLALANDVTDKLASDKKLNQSYQEIRLLTKHLQNIREEERTHIAREIHDELGQQLTVLKMDVSWLNKKLASGDEVMKGKLKGILDLLDGTVRSVRRISSELRPSLLDDLGLIAAVKSHLKEFEKRGNVKSVFSADEQELTLPEEMKTGLFRIFQESLTNVARHANAKIVSVSLRRRNGEVILSIKDDGDGFDQLKEAGKKTLGILGMEERSSMMGGKYQINSIPGKGTLVEVSVPFELKTN